MSAFRDPAPREVRQQVFSARFVRPDMAALAMMALVFAAFLAFIVPPQTDVHCLQLSRTCSVDVVYLGFLPVHDLLDLREAIGPARIVGVGKGNRYLVVSLEGGGERRLGQFGAATDLVQKAVTAFSLTQRDTDASHGAFAEIVLLVLGIASSATLAFGLARERIAITLRSDGTRIRATVERRWRAARTLDFALGELTAFAGHVETRKGQRGGSVTYYRLEARLERAAEEVVPEMRDHRALHALTAQLNHFLETLPERADSRGPHGGRGTPYASRFASA